MNRSGKGAVHESTITTVHNSNQKAGHHEKEPLMHCDWIVKTLLLGIFLLLGLNLMHNAATPAMADDQAFILPNGGMLNLGKGLVLVKENREVYLLGIRKTYDHPVEDHEIQSLDIILLDR